ncbi:MAG TPA: hypothetical protein VH107_03620 [Lacipirellulaceae bacterium]|nr:hypothetical protein [Lacipirellulaceae bacterium]
MKCIGANGTTIRRIAMILAAVVNTRVDVVATVAAVAVAEAVAAVVADATAAAGVADAMAGVAAKVEPRAVVDVTAAVLRCVRLTEVRLM